jgi:hypothetical protein
VPTRQPRGFAARQQLAGLVRHDDWQRNIEKALDAAGWTWTHTKRAKVPQRRGTDQPEAARWLTPMAKGFPDLLALRDGHLLVIEVKTEGEYPDRDQRKWLELFHQMEGALVWVCRPSDDWADLVRWLQRPESAPAVHGWEPAADKAARQAASAARRERRSRPGSDGESFDIGQ